MSTIGDGRLHGAIQPLCSFCLKILSHTPSPALKVHVGHSGVSDDSMNLGDSCRKFVRRYQALRTTETLEPVKCSIYFRRSTLYASLVLYKLTNHQLLLAPAKTHPFHLAKYEFLYTRHQIWTLTFMQRRELTQKASTRMRREPATSVVKHEAHGLSVYFWGPGR